jgi:putative transposase
MQMPRIGTRKLHYMLTETLQKHSISIGRDKLFDLLEEYGLLVRRRKRKRIHTTDSRHSFRKYPNLIRGLQPLRPIHLWVSDRVCKLNCVIHPASPAPAGAGLAG